MLLSIIMPVYNAKKYINKSINSILNQNYEDYELILVDDGSNDGTYDIIKKYSEKNKKIKIYKQNNKGSGAARNLGITKAKGKYLYFPDSDDTMVDGSLNTIDDVIRSNDSDLYVFSYNELERENDKIIDRKIKRDQKYDDMSYVYANYEKFLYDSPQYIQGAPWNKVFKKDIINKYNIKYPNLRRHQDELFILRYVDKIKTLQITHKCIYNYYINTNDEKLKKFPEDYFEIRTKLYEEFIKITNGWKIDKKKINAVLSYGYLATVLKCIEFLFNEKYNYSKNRVLEKYKQIERNSSFRSAIERLNVPKAKEYIIKSGVNPIKYRLVMAQLKMITSNHERGILTISKAKYIINKTI